jgi:hypothetical protein
MDEPNRNERSEAMANELSHRFGVLGKRSDRKRAQLIPRTEVVVGVVYMRWMMVAVPMPPPVHMVMRAVSLS